MRKIYKNKVLRIAALCFISVVLLFVFLFYGPFSFLRNAWITSAMTSLSHHWLATSIYSDATINRVLTENTIISLKENTDPSLITVTNSDDTIEKTEITENYFKGYLLKIRNPMNVRIVPSAAGAGEGQKLHEYLEKYNARAGINGSGFADSSGHTSGGIPVGLLISDKKTIYSMSHGVYDNVIAITDQGKLVLGAFTEEEILKSNIRDACTFSPHLIINGKLVVIKGDGGWGIAPRTAIGQTADGTILLLVIDGRQLSTIGASIADVQRIMAKYGAINAACLDGGASSIMMLYGKNVNYPCTSLTGRHLPNAIIVL